MRYQNLSTYSTETERERERASEHKPRKRKSQDAENRGLSTPG